MERINDAATYKAVQFALKICDNRFIGSARACSIAANYWHANEQDTRKHVRKRLWDTACKEAQAQNGYYSIYVTGADVPMLNAYNKGYCLICPDCTTPQYFDINDDAAINRAYVSPCINPECGYVDIQQRGNIRKELYKYYVSTGVIPD